jgi:hypothetical protein
MQTTSKNTTSIKPTEVIKSPTLSTLKMNCETYPFFHEQSGVKLGSSPISASKELPKIPQYTPQQVVAFGGFMKRLCTAYGRVVDYVLSLTRMSYRWRERC